MIGGLYVLDKLPTVSSEGNNVINCDGTAGYTCNRFAINNSVHNNFMSCSNNGDNVYIDSVYDYDPLHLHIWHKRLAHASHTTLQHMNSPDIPKLITEKNVFET